MIKITFHYRYRKQIFIALIFLLLVASLVVAIVVYYPKEEKKSTISIINKKETNKNQKEEKENEIMYKVDVKGEIISPGIYTLPATSRVIDVIEAAGGLTEQANTTVINLSKKISDEMVIIVYSNEDVANFTKTKEIEAEVQKECQQKDENTLKNDACICEEETKNTGLISLNKATIEELITLPGIGEAKAKDIIAYRSDNGLFKSIEEVKNIPGIGDSLFAKIKDYITI